MNINVAKSLIDPGHFGSGIDNILIIKNFVDKEDLKTIQNFLPTISEWVDPGESLYSEDGTCLYSADYWRNRQCSGDIIQKLNNNIYEIIEYYINKMQKVLETQFSVKLSNRPPVLIKWTPGTEQRPHADKQLNDGSPNPFPDYDLNSLIYYNDNFQGGELYYPEHDIVIKPEPGLAVAHPGDINYLHGVKKIISGERWTTPSFYTVTDLL
jgi:hypothetical protein